MVYIFRKDNPLTWELNLAKISNRSSFVIHPRIFVWGLNETPRSDFDWIFIKIQNPRSNKVRILTKRDMIQLIQTRLFERNLGLSIYEKIKILTLFINPHPVGIQNSKWCNFNNSKSKQLWSSDFAEECLDTQNSWLIPNGLFILVY